MGIHSNEFMILGTRDQYGCRSREFEGCQAPFHKCSGKKMKSALILLAFSLHQGVRFTSHLGFYSLGMSSQYTRAYFTPWEPSFLLMRYQAALGSEQHPRVQGLISLGQLSVIAARVIANNRCPAMATSQCNMIITNLVQRPRTRARHDREVGDPLTPCQAFGAPADLARDAESVIGNFL